MLMMSVSVCVYYFLVTITEDWVFDVEAEDSMKLIKYSHVHACNDNFTWNWLDRKTYYGLFLVIPLDKI